ncbi:MAG: hypothetical protein V7731_12760 [Amphritea sp.]
MNQQADEKASPAADSIYNADLVIIENRVWLIMGTGKSDAARIAANHDENNLGSDSIALQRVGDTLFAKYDPGSIPDDIEKFKERHHWHKVDVVTYCFSKEETIKTYEGKLPALLEVDQRAVALLASNAPYPEIAASHISDPEQLAKLEDPNRRWQRFSELIKDVADTTFVLVPYMLTVQQKALLYKAYKPGQPVTPESFQQEA